MVSQYAGIKINVEKMIIWNGVSKGMTPPPIDQQRLRIEQRGERTKFFNLILPWNKSENLSPRIHGAAVPIAEIRETIIGVLDIRKTLSPFAGQHPFGKLGLKIVGRHRQAVPSQMAAFTQKKASIG